MLSRRIGSVLGVGERREKLFRRLGIRTVADLLTIFPVAMRTAPPLRKFATLRTGRWFA